MSKPKVLVAFDSMRYPNTGLFHFGKSLGRALLRNNGNQFDLNFFLHPSTTEFDKDKVNKIRLQKYHKLFYINFQKIQLFHFTDQLPRLNPVMVKGKKVLTIHDLNQVHEHKSDKAVQEYLKGLGERIAACDRIVAISQFVANDVLSHFPSAADKLSVIYNGADKLILKDGHEPAYKPARPFLFTIGIVSAKKNFHVLPALLTGHDYELVIAGIKTPYEAEVMAAAQRHGFADRVKIIGIISDDDKAWYYANCKAFVFPSIAEGFGLPVVEAMHFGKPVFCSTYTSLPEIGGHAAYYFDSFDAGAMRETFRRGMDDFEENMRSETIKVHADKFDWDNTASQYLQLYKDLFNS